MYTWKVYYENVDTDDEKKFIGIIEAISRGEALRKASEYWDVPIYDLEVEFVVYNARF